MKHGHHSTEMKKELTNRLNRISGQIKGVLRMIEEDVYCDDIINQITSIQAALGSARNILLSEHIKSCVKQSIEEDNMGIIDELMKTLKRTMK